MLVLVISVWNRHIITVFIGEIGVIVLNAHNGYPLKLIWRWRTNHRLLHHTLGTVIIVSYKVTVVITVFGEYLANLVLNLRQRIQIAA